MSLPELTQEKKQTTKNDTFCNNIIHHMHCNTNEKYFTDAMGILHKKVIDFNSIFLSVVVPKYSSNTYYTLLMIHIDSLKTAFRNSQYMVL